MIRLQTKEVKVGQIKLGNQLPIISQTMTTTDTLNTHDTIMQTISCIEAGAEMVRITAPSKKEAENLKAIESELRNKGYSTPLVADIHYTPNAAEIAAGIVQKVRINPGNFVDKKKFENIEYTDDSYNKELQKIEEKFIVLLEICKAHGTALRIGTNHGSLSDRIMSRFGDTAIGMVESAMEFLRIARRYDFHDIVLSMKSSNPLVMIDAYKLLVQNMTLEFGECYPLHLGVTEAGDGEDGRIKSAIGIGTLMEDGIGDTIRVSLTEDPEFEIPVCKAIISRFENKELILPDYKNLIENKKNITSSPLSFIGGKEKAPLVFVELETILSTHDLNALGYVFHEETRTWTKKDIAVDGIIINQSPSPNIQCPNDLTVIYKNPTEQNLTGLQLFPWHSWISKEYISTEHAVECTIEQLLKADVNKFSEQNFALVIYINNTNTLSQIRDLKYWLHKHQITNPIIWKSIARADCNEIEQTIDHSIQMGMPFIENIGDGILCVLDNLEKNIQISFGVLQAVRKRITKTEFISCPSCGRTLFDLQSTTAKIKEKTSHLKGLKIAIMGCIVNGPGELADADFGYVGSGIGKVSLYKGQEVIKKNVNTENAVEELVALLKEYQAWQEPMA